MAGENWHLPLFGHDLEKLLPSRQTMLNTMTTILKPSDPFPAAARAVERVMLARADRIVDIHPLADELAGSFPRHSHTELCAAVVTAVALRGAAMRWHALPAP